VEGFKYDRKNLLAPELTDEQKLVHEQFKAKLNQTSYLISSNDTANTEEESDLEEEQPVKPTKKAKKATLTPLEQQAKDFKLNHLDKVLAIQVGYKYKFFCEDAVKVSKILNIMLVPGKINLLNETVQDLQYSKLAYCSIPEPRLHIHLQRLLDNGLKVGVVDQVETSTIKNVDSGGSSLFKRKLTNVFTKATYVEYDDKNNVGIKSDKTSDSIVSIIEEKGLITLVSFQPLTGDIIHDEFADVEFLRTELRTRLSHLEPLEFLYFQNSLSPETEKVINQLNLNHNLRVITYPILKKDHYLNLVNEVIDDSIVEFMFTKSKNFQICCSLLIEYLKEFQLDSAFTKLSNFIPFSHSNSMIINSNTLENLEILRNSTNEEQKGSLIWVLDHTRTKFGYRLLKRWILSPLIHVDLINHRLDAVEEIKSNFNHFLESLANSVLKNCQDLEKNLNRLNYAKIKRKELYTFLFKFTELENVIIKFGKFDIVSRLNSKYLSDIFKRLIKEILDLKPNDLIRIINSQYALDDSNEDHVSKYFNMNYLHEFIAIDDILEQDRIIKSIQDELKEELGNIRKVLLRPSLDYVEKQKEPYLIEVRNALLKAVPKDWLKINSTKTISRFRTPTSSSLYQKLKYHQEVYVNISHEIFSRFTKKLADKYESLSIIIQELARFDCLLSLTTISSQVDYSRPQFTDSSTKLINLKNSRNPIIESLNTTNSIVPNSIHMDENSSHLIITGPNMGGKSSLVKQVALIQIMAQIGCFIPADSNSVLSCFNKILTRMGAKDDLIRGESTFYIEMSQVSKILEELESCKGNALVILDEVGRGTGTVDGISIAESILEYLLTQRKLCKNTFVLFITHFPSICKLKNKYPQVENYHMGFIEENQKSTSNNEEISWPKITFLYELRKGMSSSSYGLNVANLAGIDKEILNIAFLKSQERKAEVEQNRRLQLFSSVKKLLTTELLDPLEVVKILEKIE
jgi:DNA mismatch repair protein MSH3